MPDNKKKRGKRDRDRVASNETYEVDYAARKFGVTATEVRDAIKKVGNSRTALKKYFRK